MASGLHKAEALDLTAGTVDLIVNTECRVDEMATLNAVNLGADQVEGVARFVDLR